MTRCPRCDTPNRPEAAFCATCGGRLGDLVFEPAASTPLAEPTRVPPDPTYDAGTRPRTGVLTACPSCGAAMAAGSERCFACGYGTTVTVTREPQGGRGIIIFTACAAVLAVVAGLVGLYLWRSGADEGAAGRQGDGVERSVDTSEPPVSQAPATAVELPAATEPPAPPTTIAGSVAATAPPVTLPPTTPTVTLPPATLPPATLPVVVAPPATPPPAPVVPTTVPGDLSIVGYPMALPPCDGSYVVALGSFGPEQAGKIREVLVDHPGAIYLRTTNTCSSLRWYFPDSDTPIYMVVYGPYASSAEACGVRDGVRSEISDTYARVLDTVTPLGTDPC